MQDSLESPRNKSLLTKVNQIVTPEDGRHTSQLRELNRASKTDGSIHILVSPNGMKQDLSRTHVEGFRRAAHELESLMEQGSKQTVKLISDANNDSKTSVAPITTDFNKSLISGFRRVIQGPSELTPACFCEVNGPCKKHTQFEPTMETMIELLE